MVRGWGGVRAVDDDDVVVVVFEGELRDGSVAVITVGDVDEGVSVDVLGASRE
jgi:hypothetical protein